LAKRRVLLVDDEVTVLLTMKAVLEISGFDVDTAASAREGKSRIKLREYQLIITDMRMESDAAGREVIQAARVAPYHPAIALLTAYPEDDFGDINADKVLVKARATAALLADIEKLLETHAAKLQRLATAATPSAATPASPAKKAPVKKSAAKRLATKKLATKAVANKKAPAGKKAPVERKKVVTKKRKR
jgi:DNA-binding response OmpR family regulator